MNDVRSLLSEAVPDDLRTANRWPDAESDIARGRALLVRRRRLALAGGTGLVAAGAVGALLLTGPLTPTGHSPIAGASSTGGSATGSVALVAYEGTQPKGYTLKTIPQGWEIASADNTALVLHRIGTPKGGSFEDKILIEGDLNPFPKSGDQTVEVNGHKGWFFGHKSAGYSVTLIFQTGQQRPVDTTPGKANPSNPKLAKTRLNVMVQLPHSLNWNVTTTTKFASGITVADGAGGAVG
ncbi:MAG: hypothetical protein JWN00_5727 [Actinomycetia bacterium]|jgi:hypothetical protein|nr:hypothetical protein [Actinomycetes bacterium]